MSERMKNERDSLDDLRVRFNAAKLAGRRVADDTIYTYAFRSNEQAADLAVEVVVRWLVDAELAARIATKETEK